MESGQMIEWKDLDKRRYFLFGPGLFVGVRLLTFPFNLIKTRLFMQEKKSIYTGTLDAFYKIAKFEGIRGLYKGYLVSLIGLVSGQVYIVTYELTRNHLHGYRTELKGLIAGTFATLVAQTITVPIDIVTQHHMIAGQIKQWKKESTCTSTRLPSAIDIIRKILERQGVRGLFKGYTISIMTYAPNSALWWSFYSGGFQRAAEKGLLDTFPLPIVQAGVGMTAGLLSSVLTNPMDVLRTRYQVYYVHICTIVCIM